ncbi:MAG: sigma-70 family RNA polymerase sigma factor [Oscillospiraceae bacterium]|nr:sigma-70 family RNA polymerase sigma factor [Oscillospiraceae bacterium]
MKNDHLGGERRLAELINEYQPYISSVCSGFEYEYLGLAREDLELEGMLGLFRALESFDSSRDTSFFTYARRCIVNAVTSAVRTAARKKHLPLNEGLSFELVGDRSDGSGGEIDALVLRETLENIVEGYLSPLEREALRLHLDGIDGEEAARRLGRSLKSAENALGRARRKIEKMLYE